MSRIDIGGGWSIDPENGTPRPPRTLWKRLDDLMVYNPERGAVWLCGVLLLGVPVAVYVVAFILGAVA